MFCACKCYVLIPTYKKWDEADVCVFVYVYVCIYIYSIYIYIQHITEYVQTNQNQNWTESRACELESKWQICITHIHKHTFRFSRLTDDLQKSKSLAERFTNEIIISLLSLYHCPLSIHL